MTDKEINLHFNDLVKSCPHGKSNTNCPFDFFRNIGGELEINEIFSDHNKYLMLKYHKVCNGLRNS